MLKKILCLLVILASTTAFAQAPSNLSGTIAYMRVVGATEQNPGVSELHLVDPDGSNDRVIWLAPRGSFVIYPNVFISPNGQEIAFSSPHEFSCSAWDSDIFLIKPDGSDLRRITNAPGCDELNEYPKGSVTVTVENRTFDSSGIFGFYVQGATHLPEITVPWGTSKTVTINNVADLGTEQFVFAKGGAGTWFNPASYAFVEPNETVTATGEVSIQNGFGPYQFRINELSWKGDGSEIAYIVEAGLREAMPINPEPLRNGQAVFSANAQLVSTALAWSPVNDDFLYYSQFREPNGIYRGARGTDAATHELVVESSFVLNIDWLPDVSGFVLSLNEFGFFNNALWRYDFATKEATRILEGGIFTSGIVLSPDAAHYTYSDKANENAPVVLHGSSMDGAQKWQIIEDFVSWDWGVLGDGPPTGGGTELGYDSGTPTTGYSWPSAGQGSAVRFTPSMNSARLTKARIHFTSIDEGAQHALRVLSDNNGAPGVTIWGPRAVTAPETGWVEYDLSQENINVSGDFYVMIEYDGTNKPSFGSENTAPLTGRSWDFDGANWTLFGAEDYLIRAVVDVATSVGNDEVELHRVPTDFILAQNYPNPFNPGTEIQYALSQDARVSLEIFDLLGRRVAILLENKFQQAGQHRVHFDASASQNTITSGVYIYRMTAASQSGESISLTKKMTLLK